jgi:hypothetical protein
MSILARSLAFALTAALVSIVFDLLQGFVTTGATAAHRVHSDPVLHLLVHFMVFIVSATGALLSFLSRDADPPPLGSVLRQGLLAGGFGLPAAAWFNGRYGPLAGGAIFFAVALIATRWGARLAAR